VNYSQAMTARPRHLQRIASSPVLRRLLGPPPTQGTSREEQLRYVRRCAVLPLPSVALLWLVVLAFGHNPTWLLVVLGVGTAGSLETVASLSWRIRRARRSDESAQSN
jgi:hypothetical protein